MCIRLLIPNQLIHQRQILLLTIKKVNACFSLSELQKVNVSSMKFHQLNASGGREDKAFSSLANFKSKDSKGKHPLF